MVSANIVRDESLSATSIAVEDNRKQDSSSTQQLYPCPEEGLHPYTLRRTYNCIWEHRRTEFLLCIFEQRTSFAFVASNYL